MKEKNKMEEYVVLKRLLKRYITISEEAPPGYYNKGNWVFYNCSVADIQYILYFCGEAIAICKKSIWEIRIPSCLEGVLDENIIISILKDI